MKIQTSMETIQTNAEERLKMLKLMLLLMVVGAVMVPISAFAITTPVTGSFAYDIYDIGVNDILQGPIGFIVGVGAIVFGAIEGMRSRIIPAVAAVLGGAALLKAASIVTSLGMIR